MKSFLIVAICILSACSPKQESAQLNVAAAANLQRVFDPLAKSFEQSSGIKLIPSFSASTQLAQQIENGGPFDVFLSADTAQVDRLVSKSLAVDGSRTVYARGVLVLSAPKHLNIKMIEDLAKPEVKKVGIANPELAPYGKAAIETLTSLRLWPTLESKIVYGPNISVVAQFADSGNTDASFTALALVIETMDHRIVVPENLHKPIDQALCIVKATQHLAAAQKFDNFLLSTEGQAIMSKFGYLKPGSAQ